MGLVICDPWISGASGIGRDSVILRSGACGRLREPAPEFENPAQRPEVCLRSRVLKSLINSVCKR